MLGVQGRGQASQASVGALPAWHGPGTALSPPLELQGDEPRLHLRGEHGGRCFASPLAKVSDQVVPCVSESHVLSERTGRWSQGAGLPRREEAPVAAGRLMCPLGPSRQPGRWDRTTVPTCRRQPSSQHRSRSPAPSLNRSASASGKGGSDRRVQATPSKCASCCALCSHSGPVAGGPGEFRLPLRVTLQRGPGFCSKLLLS